LNAVAERPLERWGVGILLVACAGYVAGGFAPFTEGRTPFGEAGWPMVLAGAALAWTLRRGVGLETLPLVGALVRGLRGLDRRGLFVLYLCFVALVGWAAARRYLAFGAHAYDLAIFDQAIWATSRGHFLFSSIKGDIVLLGDHFSPVLVAFAPLYWLWEDPRVLVLAQAAVLGLGAFPLFSLARRLLGPGALAALFPVAYLLSAPVRNIALRDFHPECVAIPALLFALVALHERRRVRLLVAVLVVLACKETCALAVVGLGLYAWFVARERHIGVALAVVGVLAFFLEVKLGLPYFAGKTTPYTSRYGHLGASFGEILLSPLRHPFQVASLLVWPTAKLEGLTRLLAPYGMMALFAPLALVGALPNYLANAMADYPPMHNVNFHYHAEMTPFFAVAGVLGAAALLARRPRWRTGLAVVLAVSALGQVGRPEIARLWETPITARHERIAELLAAIPEDVAVAADTRTATHLAHRLRLFHFPSRVGEAQLVAVDRTVQEHAWHVTQEEWDRAFAALPGQGFVQVHAEDGFYLFRRAGTDSSGGTP